CCRDPFLSVLTHKRGSDTKTGCGEDFLHSLKKEALYKASFLNSIVYYPKRTNGASSGNGISGIIEICFISISSSYSNIILFVENHQVRHVCLLTLKIFVHKATFYIRKLKKHEKYS
ncbi:TPA: hypothetical protein ACQUHP_006554, partial [Bacillus cereus]